MAPTGEALGNQLTFGEGSLLVGDIGLVTVKAMLENGVGYIVAGWLDQSNPIDAAIGDVQHGVLARSGVLLRRLRSFNHIETVVRSPGRGIGGDAAALRGVVVWNGRSGVRPALERFCALEVPAPVVGICFDPQVARSDRAIVVEPEPNPRGLVRAFDEAFALSYATGHPTLVLVRERLLRMRGTLRCRDNVRPSDAPAFVDAIETGQPPAAAIANLGVNRVDRPGCSRAIVCATPLAAATARSLEIVDAALASIPTDGLDEAAPQDAAGIGQRVTLVGLEVATLLAPHELEAAIGEARDVLVLEGTGSGLAARVRSVLAPDGEPPRIEAASLSHDRATVGDVVRAVAAWLAGDHVAGREDARLTEVADLLATPLLPASLAGGDVPGRIPRRGATLARDIAPPLAAGLVLAQAALGVPTRLDDAFPTYRLESGAMLTVTGAAAFAERGLAIAAPPARTGTFVVAGPPAALGHVQATAAAAGATVEVVAEGSPAAIASALERACAAPRALPHVIVTAPSVVAVSPRCNAGYEPALLGADRLATATLPPGQSEISETDDELLSGPVVQVLDPVAAQGSIAAASEVSPAWYEVRVEPFAGRARRLRHAVNRKLLRSLLRMEA